VSGSGISWAICKSAPIAPDRYFLTTPTLHRSVFYRPDVLPAAQPTVSETLIFKFNPWQAVVIARRHCWRRGVVVSGVRRINEVNPRRARLVPGMGDRLRPGILSRYVTSQLCQLSLAVLVELRLVTDRQTQAHGLYRGCIASRGKNQTLCSTVEVDGRTDTTDRITFPGS